MDSETRTLLAFDLILDLADRCQRQSTTIRDLQHRDPDPDQLAELKAKLSHAEDIVSSLLDRNRDLQRALDDLQEKVDQAPEGDISRTLAARLFVGSTARPIDLPDPIPGCASYRRIDPMTNWSRPLLLQYCDSTHCERCAKLRQLDGVDQLEGINPASVPLVGAEYVDTVGGTQQ